MIVAAAIGLGAATYVARIPADCTMMGGPRDVLVVRLDLRALLVDADRAPSSADVCIDGQCVRGRELERLPDGTPLNAPAFRGPATDHVRSVTVVLHDRDGHALGSWVWVGEVPADDLWINGVGCDPHAWQKWFVVGADGSLAPHAPFPAHPFGPIKA